MMRTITPFLSIVIAVLLLFFFTQPQYDNIQVVQKEIDEYSSATEKYKEFSTKLEEKLNSIQTYSLVQNSRLARLAPQDLDEAKLLVDIEDIVKRQNMLFGNIDVETRTIESNEGPDAIVSEETELITVDVTFEAIGTYEQFKSLLRSLEQSLTLLEVTEISFSVIEDSPFQQYGLTVRAFGIPQ